MKSKIMLYIGATVIILWGISHILPTQAVVKSFGAISEESQLIITMEWVAEGLTLIFIGALALYMTLQAGSDNPVSIMAYRALALMLLVMAVWTGLTGARTSIIPIKICPFVKTTVAILFFLASLWSSRKVSASAVRSQPRQA